MKRNHSYITAALILLTVVVGSIILKNRHPDPEPKINHPSSRTHSSQPTKSTPLSSAHTAGSREEHHSRGPIERNPLDASAEVEGLLDHMHAAAITYDPAQLPQITPYLLHPNLEVRKAAIDAMITLGDAAAGPLLRNAASKAYTPYEAVAMIEAANYVELPSAKLKFKEPDDN